MRKMHNEALLSLILLQILVFHSQEGSKMVNIICQPPRELIKIYKLELYQLLYQILHLQLQLLIHLNQKTNLLPNTGTSK